MPGKILIVDDELPLCQLLKGQLEQDGFEAEYTTNPLEVVGLLKDSGFDVVIQDIKMPKKDGLELLKEINEGFPELPVFIVTAHSTWERAVDAVKRGATDYIEKPFNYEEDIKGPINLILDMKRRGEAPAILPQKVMDRLGIVVGVSKSIKKIWYLVLKAARAVSTVMIQGESGVGKEIIAKTLHYLSPRSAGPFVAINCGALPDTLLESELFGHVKGAFTDANSDKVGLVEVADEGTLFLDEISETSPVLQVKLLRAIEEREIRPVGGTRTKRINVRFITATNKDIAAEVKAGNFRQDLYYRLNVIPIHVPPLRERKEDIPHFADKFLDKHKRQFKKEIKGFAEDAKNAIEEYDWPGNIRELDNFIQRAVALSDGEYITKSELFETFVPSYGYEQKGEIELQDGIDLDQKLQETEKEYIKRALALTNNNRTKAAALLKMSLSSLVYKIKRYKLL